MKAASRCERRAKRQLERSVHPCCLEARVPLLCFAQSSRKTGIGAKPGSQRITGDVWRIEEATANRCLEVMQRTFGLPEEGRKVHEPVMSFAVNHHVLLECVQDLRHRIAIAKIGRASWRE